MNFDSYSDTYQETIEKSIGLFGQKHAFFVHDKIEWLQKAFSEVGQLKNLRVLDIGCGIGLGHRIMADAVGEMHGVDISQESLNLAARDNPNVRYQLYDGKRLPYDDNSFECASAICVLHHVRKELWLPFVEEMARVVIPGGQIVVIEHNPINPATQWIVRNCELDRDAILLMPWRLRQLFLEARIHFPKIRFTLFTTFSNILFRRIDRALSRLPFGAQYVIMGRK